MKRKKQQAVVEKDKELHDMEREYEEEKARQEKQIMQLEKEQAIFKKERIRAEHKISANRQDIEKAERFIAQVNADRKYITLTPESGRPCC